MDASSQRPPSSATHAYSPEGRTALVLCGTGAHGAYHAGALRAVREGGVKVDVVAGCGVGAANAAIAALDGGARLWEASGIWSSPGTGDWYRWHRPLRIAGWLTCGLAGVLVVPLIVLMAGMLIALAAFLLETLGLETGGRLLASYGGWVQAAFAGPRLPTYVPRAAVIVIAAIAAVLAVGTLAARRSAPGRKRYVGGWWRLFGAPLDVTKAHRGFARAVRHLIQGVTEETATGHALSRRFSETLAESLGQPGFCELLIAATDVDARQDVVAALLREPFRKDFFGLPPERERTAEALDLAGVGRDHAFDVVMGALVPFAGANPHLIAYGTDTYWRGETHRLTDRPGLAHRLLEELDAAGVTQVIVVSACPQRMAPHRLGTWALDLRRRLGDALSAAEAASLRDAIAAARERFDEVYVIGPEHNAISPFDFRGAYDDASDRHEALSELMERGYEDAYRQFIEPIVGASGEQLTAENLR